MNEDKPANVITGKVVLSDVAGIVKTDAFEFHLGVPIWKSRILVNGKPVTGVRSFTLRFKPDEMMVAELELVPGSIGDSQ